MHLIHVCVQVVDFGKVGRAPLPRALMANGPVVTSGGRLGMALSVVFDHHGAISSGEVTLGETKFALFMA